VRPLLVIPYQCGQVDRFARGTRTRRITCGAGAQLKIFADLIRLECSPTAATRCRSRTGAGIRVLAVSCPGGRGEPDSELIIGSLAWTAE
jgi:hypothetical protein